MRQQAQGLAAPRAATCPPPHARHGPTIRASQKPESHAQPPQAGREWGTTWGRCAPGVKHPRLSSHARATAWPTACAAAVPLSPGVSICECLTSLYSRRLVPFRHTMAGRQRLAGFASNVATRDPTRAATHDQAIVLHTQRPPPCGRMQGPGGQHQQSQPTPKTARQHQGARLDAVVHPPLQRQQSQGHRRGPAPSGLLDREGPGVLAFRSNARQRKKARGFSGWSHHARRIQGRRGAILSKGGWLVGLPARCARRSNLSGTEAASAQDIGVAAWTARSYANSNTPSARTSSSRQSTRSPPRRTVGGGVIRQVKTSY